MCVHVNEDLVPVVHRLASLCVHWRWCADARAGVPLGLQMSWRPMMDLKIAMQVSRVSCADAFEFICQTPEPCLLSSLAVGIATTPSTDQLLRAYYDGSTYHRFVHVAFSEQDVGVWVNSERMQVYPPVIGLATHTRCFLQLHNDSMSCVRQGGESLRINQGNASFWDVRAGSRLVVIFVFDFHMLPTEELFWEYLAGCRADAIPVHLPLSSNRF